VGSVRLRGFVFCPGGSAVWPQCWLCAVCAVGHIGCCVGGEYPVGVSISSPHRPTVLSTWCAVGRAGCCVGGGVPCGGKHIIIAGPGCPDTSREGRLMIPPTRRIARLRLSHKLSLQVSCSPGRWPPAVARASPKHLSTSS